MFKALRQSPNTVSKIYIHIVPQGWSGAIPYPGYDYGGVVYAKGGKLNLSTFKLFESDIDPDLISL